MNQSPPFWQTLFAPDAPGGSVEVVPMKLLKKRGQPLLLLPSQPKLARRALELYPAQTTRSRLARTAAALLLRSGLPFGLEPVQVSVAPDGNLLRWLGELTRTRRPSFAVLAGNPNSPGQRLIVLLFNEGGEPAVVVKAGLSAAAQGLIAQEQLFFNRLPAGTRGIPTLRATFANRQLQALALDYLPGRSPIESDEHSLPAVLTGWLRPRQQIEISSTCVWKELTSVCADHPIFKVHAPELQARSCGAAVYHGDFAPWNVRVSPQGEWMVLDWERGEVAGLPAWDWFHYWLQKAILVQRCQAEQLAGLAEQLLVNEEFKAYAHASGIAGLERALLQLYLLHHAEVVRPSEGLLVTRELLGLVAARWR